MIHFDPFADLVLIAVAWKLFFSKPSAPLSVPDPVLASRPKPFFDVPHEVLRRDENGEWQTVSQHFFEEGIGDEIKTALRTPGMAVRWCHGGIEEGCE